MADIYSSFSHPEFDPHADAPVIGVPVFDYSEPAQAIGVPDLVAAAAEDSTPSGDSSATTKEI